MPLLLSIQWGRIMIFGLLNLSVWGYIFATLILTQITIVSVTIYLHRYQTHRALTLHPAIGHFFRFWLWLTTGMVTKEWVAIHRKHHATTEKEGDPHSPVVLGIKKVFWEGVELYREACEDKASIEKYSHGTPDDWIERNIYSRHSTMGIVLMLFIDLLLFGIPGISIWATQMLWIPLFAAGVINGIGHYWGYRNFECTDASRNIIPWGFWIGGEELHNNHHTFPSSAKFSVKWWEFDIGWFFIRGLSLLRLAKVKKLPQELLSKEGKVQVDVETVRAIISNRFRIMAAYYNTVVCPVFQTVKLAAKEKKMDLSQFRHSRSLFKRQDLLLNEKAKNRLQTLLAKYEQLRQVYDYRQSLQNVWLKTASSQKELLDSLQLWCRQAEESGNEALRQFSVKLRSYVPKYAVIPS